MKICSPQLGISPESSLGGEIYDYQTLKGFTKKGISVFVYLPKNRTYDKSLKKFHVEYCFMTHIIPPWIYSFICLPYLFRTYKKEKFDILRIHSPRYLGIAGIIFHTFYQTPIIVSAVTPQPSKYLFWIEKYLYKISSKIIVQSYYMKKQLATSFKIPINKIEVTYGGVDTVSSKIKKSQTPNLFEKDDVLLVYMGLINKRKNPRFLLKVIKKVINEFPKLKLVIIGQGEQKKDIKNDVKKMRLEKNVIFIDKAYGEDKIFWLSKMDIFLMPSLDEGLGLALVEAMSFGKTALVSDIEPFREVIDNEMDGYIAPLKVDIWVNKTITLIKNRKLRENIGNRAKEKVNSIFSWGKMYDQNAIICQKLIK